MKRNHILSSVAALALSAIIASILLVACSKNSSMDSSSVPPGEQNMSLYMTDGPGFFDHVYIDVRSIEVLIDTSGNTRMHDRWDWDNIGSRIRRYDSTLVWDTLSVNTGVVDLLKLNNGTDTLLAAANVKIGSVRLIRIDLGNNNSLVKDSVNYPLQLPPNAPSYILIKLLGNEWQQFANNSFRLWLDFDAGRSIIQVRSNAFYLIPFIRAFVVSNTGSISGVVLPLDAKPVISIYNNTDTAYAIPRPDGEFKVRGLANGTYSVNFNASSSAGFKDTTINNVIINNANNISLGVVRLHK